MWRSCVMKWEAKIIKHKNEMRIAVYFEKNDDWNSRIKQQTGAKWSNKHRAWHLPDTTENREKYSEKSLQNIKSPFDDL